MTARLAIALGTAVSVLGAPAAAYACGSGGSDSGSSSDSSSSGDSGGSYDASSSSGSSATVSEPACVDASDVNGYRTCAHYGAWGTAANLPAISIELSTWSAEIDMNDVDVDGTIEHSYGASYNYRVVGQDLGGKALAIGGKLRVLGHKGGLYGGAEAGIAGVSADEVDRMEVDAAMLRPTVNMMFIAGAAVGVEHTMGRLTLGGEVFGGMRGLKVTADSQRGACDMSESHIAARGLVEARLRADVWVTPWMTLGAYAGRDVFGAQSTAGLGIGGHMRAFDGAH